MAPSGLQEQQSKLGSASMKSVIYCKIEIHLKPQGFLRAQKRKIYAKSPESSYLFLI
jgi:hypothetical protein